MDNNTPSYLLGFSHGTLLKVQSYLIQGNYSQALSTINEDLRFLKQEIEKTFYAKDKETDDVFPLPDMHANVSWKEV